MARKRAALVPTDISEQYYQLSPEILNSFSKYRLPISLYIFKEDIAVLAPYSKRDQRLTNEQVEEVQVLCKEGSLFVSREDFPIYSEHIVKQLDLVLQDSNLKDSEVADLCERSIRMHLTEFFESPVKPAFDALYKALMVVTQWIWEDKFRLRSFLRRLQMEHSLANHSFNCMVVGLWLWLDVNGDKATRRTVDKFALAFLLHDVGMSKIPQFVRQKPRNLSLEELGKVKAHPMLGYKVMRKLDLAFDELAHCIMEHHERLDGSGYPQGSKDKQISEIGRMSAVVDTFCAMITERPHNPNAKKHEEAARELSEDPRFDKKYSARILIAIVTNKFA